MIDVSQLAFVVEDPATAFSDPELQDAKVDRNPVDKRPRSWAGGAAIVFRLTARDDAGRETAYAVRCFKRIAQDQAVRYAAISAQLAGMSGQSRFLLPTTFQEHGVQLDGAWQPISKLRWAPGALLSTFVDRHFSERPVMEKLVRSLRDLAVELERAGIAHGDLQHKNILVDDSANMRLVDYDGMYVSALRGMPANELGHEDYQHPMRSPSDFGPDLDRFSLIVLATQLLAVARHPELWDPDLRRDGLLLRQRDFQHPDISEQLAALEVFPDLRDAVQRLRELCKGPISSVVRLPVFLEETGLEHPWEPHPIEVTAVGPVTRAVRRPQIPVLSAERWDRLWKHVTDVVMVVGRLEQETGVKTDLGEATSLRIRTGGDSVTLRADLDEALTLEHCRRQAERGAIREGDWVAVSGLLTKSGPRDLVIVLDELAMLELLDADEAQQLLGRQTPSARLQPTRGGVEAPPFSAPPVPPASPAAARHRAAPPSRADDGPRVADGMVVPVVRLVSTSRPEPVRRPPARPTARPAVTPAAAPSPAAANPGAPPRRGLEDLLRLGSMDIERHERRDK